MRPIASRSMNDGKISWLQLFLDFIMVILGILIAFQINNFATNKNVSSLLDVHYQQIKEETEINQSNLSNTIIQAEMMNNLLDTTLSLINSLGSSQTINNNCFRLLNLGGAYFRKSAYSSLTESGDIRLIDDFNTKNHIINLYEYYKWVEQIDKVARTSYLEYYYPYLMKNFDVSRGTLQDREIYTSKGFVNILASYKFSQNLKIQKYKDCQKQIETFLEEFESTQKN